MYQSRVAASDPPGKCQRGSPSLPEGCFPYFLLGGFVTVVFAAIVIF